MQEQSILNEIRAFLYSHQAFAGLLPAELSLSDSLVRSGALDSLGIFHLVSFLEQKFSIQIESRDISEKNFENLQAIAGLVEKKLIAKHAAFAT